ncbi:MAG: hypothetical protein WCX88_03015 [Patescibacteria group bacterium]
MVKFNSTKADSEIIHKIADRAIATFARGSFSKLDIIMDVEAVHCNGVKLRLAELLQADKFNFMHDISGMHNCLNRTTGKLENCFLRRFAARKTKKAK